ncbi:hypothetical protein PV327_011302, partial [Microctonus hyperodae]
FGYGQVAKKVFYCEKCSSLVDTNTGCCISCQKNNNIHNFMTLSTIEQVKQIMKKENNRPILTQLRDQQCRRVDDHFQDLLDGQLYQQHQNYFSVAGSLSLMWYTDVNELPFEQRIRRDNTILAGLWFGPHKPSPNLFVNTFVDELKILYHGIYLAVPNLNEKILVRCIVLCGTCDLPAKSSFLNSQQFNSTFECVVCETPTVATKLPSKRTIRVYRYTRQYKMRSLAETIVYANEALSKKVGSQMEKSSHAEKKVKGHSIFDKFMPDYISGTAIDPTHAIYEGVVKKLIHLWVHSSFSDYTFSLRPVIHVIDSNLLQIKPPKFIHRMPRSIH